MLVETVQSGRPSIGVGGVAIEHIVVADGCLTAELDSNSANVAPEGPSYPSVVENNKPPLRGISIDSKVALAAMTRFLRCDGQVKRLMGVEGPLLEEGFESKWELRRLLQDGEGPLGWRVVAVGDTLTVCATNEKTAKVFDLLIKSALGFSFVPAD